MGGRVAPIFPATVSWQRSDTNSFWGPAMHWNSNADSYVVLLNHACCKPGWPRDGVYVSFNPDLGNPLGWTAPRRILGDVGWGPGYYPQVIGLGLDETDTMGGYRISARPDLRGPTAPCRREIRRPWRTSICPGFRPSPRWKRPAAGRAFQTPEFTDPVYRQFEL